MFLPWLRGTDAWAFNDALAPLLPWLPLVAIEAGVWAWQQLGSAPLTLVVVAHLVVAPRAAVILFRELRCCLAEFRLARTEWRRTFRTPPHRRSQNLGKKTRPSEGRPVSLSAARRRTSP